MDIQVTDIDAHIEEACASSASELPGFVDPKKHIITKEKLHGNVTSWLALTTIVVSLGASVPLGFNIGVMTVTAPFVLEFLNVTNQEKWNGVAPELAMTWIYSCTVTIYTVGGAFGSIIGGRLSDSLGRKYTLAVCAILLPIAGVMMGVCQIAGIYGLLFLGRFVAGLYAGISLGTVYVYLAEIPPVNLRGAVGVFGTMMGTFGQLLSHIIGFWGFYNQKSWPILLSLVGFMGMFMIIVLPFCPESPRWLFLKQKRYRDAEKALQRLRGANADISAEIEEMKIEAQQDESNTADHGVGAMDIIFLKNPDWKIPLLLCITLSIGFHLSGFSALFFYTTEIFTSAGFDQSEIALVTVGYSLVNVVSISVGVLSVDKFGRKPLMMYPFVGGLLLLLGLTVSINTQDNLDWMKWITIAIVFIYTSTFSFGPGSVKNVIAAELWLQSTRPAAMSVTVQATWWSMTLVTLTFPLLNEELGGYTFLIYFACLLIATIILFRYLPETKNRTFEEITARFVKRTVAYTDDLEGETYVNGGVVKDTETMEETPT